MSPNSGKTTSKRRDFAGDDTSTARRRKGEKMFVQYQPSNGSLKKVPSGKQKPNLGPSRNLSCGECRRLKLKCDRVFPCRACVRRGCQGICPNGSLVSGKGSRYILASTERLHEKISSMSERILELEDALRTLYEEHRICLVRSPLRECSEIGNRLPSIHPLLVGEKLLVKDQLELYREEYDQESADTEQQLQNNEQRVGGDSTEESCQQGGCSTQSPGSIQDAGTSQTVFQLPRSLENQVDIVSPPTLAKLSARFWPVWKRIAQGVSIANEIDDLRLEDSNLQLVKSELLGTLPSRAEVERLISVTQDAGFFILNYVLTDLDLAKIMSNIYDRRPTDTSMINAALLFILAGIGLHMDYSSSETGYDPEVDETVNNCVTRSRAAMTLHAIEQGAGDSPGLQVRSIQYHFLFMLVLVLISLRGQENQKKIDAMDVLVSLIKRANLHTESSYSQYSEREQNERRFLLYEILSIVGEMCLAQDIPMPLSSVDVGQPLACSSRFPSEVEEEYYDRRRDFYVNCVKPILDMRSVPPSDIPYSDILELDCKIRTFPFPPDVLQDYDAEPIEMSGVKPSLRRLKLLRFINTYRINTLLLHLHRRFMRQCLNTKASVLAHPYFPSVVASCLSAWVITRNNEAMHQAYPEFVKRLGLPWYNVLCAATANFIVLERVPYCPLAPYCLRELNRALDVIEKVSSTNSEIAGRAAPIVRQFVTRASETLRRWKEALDAALDTNVRLHARADYCMARFDAMVNHIKQVGSSSRGLSTVAPPPETNDPIKDGLEIWDIAHPEIGEVLTMLPGCVIDQCTSDEMLWETVHTPLKTTGGDMPRSHDARTPLMAFFDALDNRLRQRPDFLLSNEQNLETSDITNTDLLRDMFPDDIDLDWASLTGALVSAPQALMSAMPTPGWTGQWDWRDPIMS